MKTLVAILASIAVASGAFAQGTISWNNVQAATGIKFGSDSPINPGQYVNLGSYTAGLYLGASSATESALALIDSKVITIAPAALAGLITGKNNMAYTPWAAGSTVNFMVKVWTTSSGASYEAAMLANPADLLVGKSGMGQGVLGGGANPAFVAFSATGIAGSANGVLPSPVGVGAVAGFAIHQVPEPTTAAIAGLGVAAMLIFRRKK